MRRDLDGVSESRHDLVIIGAGIYGACLAWEAARRGLSVALLDAGDFGHATSANSQKIIHGGFRYLQHLDVKRIRESVRERRRFLRLAPHLVRPMPVILPTHGRGLQSRTMMRLAAWLYDLLSWDRNVGVRDPARRIPRTRMLSRAECLRRLPGLPVEGVTGAVVWHDGQIYNSERLTLAFVRAAAARGAGVANYLRVTELLITDGRVTGVRAEDRLTGASRDVRGRVVVNASGPWVNRVLGLLKGRTISQISHVKTINVIIDRPLADGHAFSVTSAPPSGAGETARRLFVTPWRGRTILGSSHGWTGETPEGCAVTSREIEGLIGDFNRAYPGARVQPEEVCGTYVGLLPHESGDRVDDPARLARRYRVVDHGRAGGPVGLLSVIGVKYTTARDVAEKTVGLILRTLGRSSAVTPGKSSPLPGGEMEPFDDWRSRLLAARPHGLADDVLEQLAANYGTECQSVLREIERDPSLQARVAPNASVIRAEVVHAVREEMAQTLEDVVFRRTELGTVGHPGEAALETCAELMARELGWDRARMAQELGTVRETFKRRCPAVPARAEAAV